MKENKGSNGRKRMKEKGNKIREKKKENKASTSRTNMQQNRTKLICYGRNGIGTKEDKNKG